MISVKNWLLAAINMWVLGTQERRLFRQENVVSDQEGSLLFDEVFAVFPLFSAEWVIGLHVVERVGDFLNSGPALYANASL